MHRQITTKCAILSKSKLFCELNTTSNEQWEHKKRNGNSKDKLAYVTSWSALRRPLRQMHFDKACCTTGLALSGLALARSKRWFFLRMAQLPSDEITWEFGRDAQSQRTAPQVPRGQRSATNFFRHFLVSSLPCMVHTFWGLLGCSYEDSYRSCLDPSSQLVH